MEAKEVIAAYEKLRAVVDSVLSVRMSPKDVLSLKKELEETTSTIFGIPIKEAEWLPEEKFVFEYKDKYVILLGDKAFDCPKF